MFILSFLCVSSCCIYHSSFQVNFVTLSGDECSFMVEPNTTTLKDLQPILVKWMGASFPKHSCSLLATTKERFIEFIDRPFRNASVGDIFTVVLDETTDTYFYDLERKESEFIFDYTPHHFLLEMREHKRKKKVKGGWEIQNCT